MKRIFKKRLFPGMFPGALKSSIFILLLAIALGFWLYTQMIFARVKEYQKAAIKTQIEVYVSLIDPRSTNDSGMDNKLVQNLIQKFVVDSPYKIIFSDEHNNPMDQKWRNVGIDTADTSRASREKLIEIMRKMDRENAPEPFLQPQLGGYHTDTLTVYEMPPSFVFPVIITDAAGKFLYGRNILADSTSPKRIREIIESIDAVSAPVRFSRENAPQLVIHGANYMGKWPIVIMDRNTGKPVYWKNMEGIPENDTTGAMSDRLTEAATSMGRDGVSYAITCSYPIMLYQKGLLHYGDLEFLFLIQWLPFIQFTVILILLTVGFIGLKNITKAEQRSIWVGMAKETAHQLGTPISSISGWLELMKTDPDPGLLDQAISEMEYDTVRLTRVAARFSSIGSRPELQPIPVSDVIDEVLDYYRARVPHMGRRITLESRYSGPLRVMGNPELLNWAFENLIKNSLAAIETKNGVITATGCMSKDFRQVIIDFRDNGKGIPYPAQSKVMIPGFTTKKRGWGLGLSLVKRIIEEYHGGRIMLLESKPGTGTTFRIVLPAVRETEQRDRAVISTDRRDPRENGLLLDRNQHEG